MYFEKLIEPEIATRPYNMFLYGRNNTQRETLLKSIAEKHPFCFRKNQSCVVYLDEFGLPAVEKKATNADDKILIDIAFRYLDFCIAEAVLKKVVASGNVSRKDSKKIINYFYFHRSANRPKNVEGLIQKIKASKEAHRRGYLNYCLTGDENELSCFAKNLDIPFIVQLEDFLKEIQDIAENKEPFMVILDRKSKIKYISVKVINSLIRSRSTDCICIKVACECNEWESEYDCYGNLVLVNHDYLIVELDDSFEKYLEDQSRHCHNDD